MIKYLDIEGYSNLGERSMFSHVYQWTEKNSVNPKIILINAFELGRKPKAFKGYLYHETKTFTSVPIIDGELSEIENLVGKIKEVDFDMFIKNTIFEDAFKGFVRSNC